MTAREKLIQIVEGLPEDKARELLAALEAANISVMHETALLSVAALAEDWSRPEEDAAWSHLQLAR